MSEQEISKRNGPSSGSVNTAIVRVILRFYATRVPTLSAKKTAASKCIGDGKAT